MLTYTRGGLKRHAPNRRGDTYLFSGKYHYHQRTHGNGTGYCFAHLNCPWCCRRKIVTPTSDGHVLLECCDSTIELVLEGWIV